MFDPVEADLYRHHLEQDEDERDARKIEEAVQAFLGECFEKKAFMDFLAAKHVTLDKLTSGLIEGAEIENGEVKVWVEGADEFISTLLEDYADD